MGNRRLLPTIVAACKYSTIIVVAMVFSSGPAATGRDMACTYYEAADSNIEHMAGILKAVPAQYVEMCTGLDATTRYFAYSLSDDAEDGICHFEMRRVFWSELMAQWTLKAPEAESYLEGIVDFRLLSNGKCPPPTDTSYVRSTGVSTKDFARLFGFWNSVVSDSAFFRTAFAKIAERYPNEAYFQEFEHIILRSANEPSLISLDSMSTNLGGSDYALTIVSKDKMWIVTLSNAGSQLTVDNIYLAIEAR